MKTYIAHPRPIRKRRGPSQSLVSQLRRRGAASWGAWLDGKLLRELCRELHCRRWEIEHIVYDKVHEIVARIGPVSEDGTTTRRRRPPSHGYGGQAPGARSYGGQATKRIEPQQSRNSLLVPPRNCQRPPRRRGPKARCLSPCSFASPCAAGCYDAACNRRAILAYKRGVAESRNTA